ncbi:MAG: stage II sporulation protein M [Blastocatellia bacterium]
MEPTVGNKYASRQREAILLAIGLLALGLCVGVFFSIPHTGGQMRSGESLQFSLSDFWVIAGRNLRIGVQLLLGVLTFGLYSAAQLFSIGINLGLTLETGTQAGVPVLKIVLLLLPHSIFEFAGFVVLGALEFEAARLMYRKLRYDRLDEPSFVIRQFACQSLIGFGFIFIGAIVETTLTVTITKHLL